MRDTNIRHDAGRFSEEIDVIERSSGPPSSSLNKYIVARLRAPLAAEARSPRQMAITSLRAASQLLGFMASDKSISPEAARILATIDANLKNVEGELEGLERHKPFGPITSTIRQRKTDNLRTLALYAKMVVAVKWLQMLHENPLRRGEAMRIVARAVCGSKSEIDSWVTHFQRPNTRRRHDTIYRLWRDLEESYRQSGRNLADATLETILLWVKED